MFKRIESIADLKPFVANKEEIRFYKQPNGITMSMYLFMDSKTFDSPEAIECRGAAFDENGKIVSRPLHKFFNMGEKDYLTPEKLLEREAHGEVVGIYEKLDGSMLATSWVNGEMQWRSKKAFNSEVVKLAKEFLEKPENARITQFAYWMAKLGRTAIFELTHPDAQIVVPQSKPQMRLLHIRDNVTGRYVMLDSNDPDEHEVFEYVHAMIHEYEVPVVPKIKMTLQQAFDALETMHNQEGYVVQFSNGDMVKIKCPWYSRLHRSITFLRERDIAMLAINEELDDMKQHMREVGISLEKVEDVEARLKHILLSIETDIREIYEQGKHLDRKEFAIKNKGTPLFGLAMQMYLGEESKLKDWYIKSRLKDDFGLKSLLEGAAAEAAEG